MYYMEHSNPSQLRWSPEGLLESLARQPAARQDEETALPPPPARLDSRQLTEVASQWRRRAEEGDKGAESVAAALEYIATRRARIEARGSRRWASGFATDATELRRAMKTQIEAIRDGYDVDLSGPGRPMGARGRYPDFEVIPLLTDMEAELLNTLSLVRKMLAEGPPNKDAQRGVVLAIDGLLSVARS